jgi:hypothetical protein
MPFHIPVQNGDTADYNLFNALPGGALLVYNNSGVSLPVGTYVKFDPSYTSGLGVTIASTLFDQRVLGPVIGGTIGIGASGYISAPGFALAQALVKDTTVFGHSLTTGSGGWLVDSGGGGWGPGIAGWALGAQGAGGPNLMNILLHPYPLFYTAAQVITQKYGANDVAVGGGTINANVVNVTPNQCLLFYAFDAHATTLVPLWNSLTPTQIQAISGALSYVGQLLGPGAATANFTGTFTTYAGVGVALALNGINQGGGAATFGTPVNQNGAGASVSLTVACVPGDIVVCVTLIKGTSVTFSGRNQTPLINAAGSATAYDVQWAIAASTSISFTLTIGGSLTGWSADAMALHSA